MKRWTFLPLPVPTFCVDSDLNPQPYESAVLPAQLCISHNLTIYVFQCHICLTQLIGPVFCTKTPLQPVRDEYSHVTQAYWSLPVSQTLPKQTLEFPQSIVFPSHFLKSTVHIYIDIPERVLPYWGQAPKPPILSFLHE